MNKTVTSPPFTIQPILGTLLESVERRKPEQSEQPSQPVLRAIPFGCQRLVLLATTQSPDGELLMEVVTRNGKGGDLTAQDKLAFWVLFANRLAEDETLGAAERAFLREVASTIPISLSGLK